MIEEITLREHLDPWLSLPALSKVSINISMPVQTSARKTVKAFTKRGVQPRDEIGAGVEMGVEQCE